MIQAVHQRQRDLYGSSAGAPALCHRLDRETSGVTVFAKHRAARVEVGRQFEERTVGKTYLALVVGVPSAGAGVIDLPLSRDPGSKVLIKQVARAGNDGQAARTRWKVLDRLDGRALLGVVAGDRTAATSSAPIWRRVGHPIVGDKLYLGGDEVFLRSLDGALDQSDRERLGLDRHALHAWKLSLIHPESHRRLELVAPVWSDISSLCGDRPGTTG